MRISQIIGRGHFTSEEIFMNEDIDFSKYNTTQLHGVLYL